RRCSARDVSTHFAIILHRDVAGCSLERQFAATRGGHKKQTPRRGRGASHLHPNMEPGNGRSFVSFAHGGAVAGRAGGDGCDVVCNWRLWDGGVLGEQAAEGIGNSYGSRRAAERSVTGRFGTRLQIGGFRFRGRSAAGNDGEPG